MDGILLRGNIKSRGAPSHTDLIEFLLEEARLISYQRRVGGILPKLTYQDSCQNWAM